MNPERLDEELAALERERHGVPPAERPERETSKESKNTSTHEGQK